MSQYDRIMSECEKVEISLDDITHKAACLATLANHLYVLSMIGELTGEKGCQVIKHAYQLLDEIKKYQCEGE